MSETGIGRRTVAHPIEVRAVNGTTIIEGYGALFNVLSAPDALPGFREILLPGAFSKRLGDDVRALWQHDPLHVLGRTKSGTLRLWEDSVGLGYEVRLPDAQWARDAAETIARGDVDQSSFSFRAVGGDSWGLDENNYPLRTVALVSHLYDVSPATFAAYEETNVEVAKRAADLRARAAADDAGLRQAQPPDEAGAESLRAQELLKLRISIRELEV